MGLILLIIILVVLFGGGGLYLGPRYGLGPPAYYGGGIGVFLVVILVLVLMGVLRF